MVLEKTVTQLITFIKVWVSDLEDILQTKIKFCPNIISMSIDVINNIVSTGYGKLEFSKYFVRAKCVPLFFSMYICSGLY